MIIDVNNIEETKNHEHQPTQRIPESASSYVVSNLSDLSLQIALVVYIIVVL